MRYGSGRSSGVTVERLNMDSRLQAEQWGPIDEAILRRQILKTLTAIRAVTGVSLREAVDIFHARYRKLREVRPEEFVCDDHTYWEGVYS
jgi:hypothetical protein